MTNDSFVGIWELNPARSAFDPNHKPSQATMRWEHEADGQYVMTATGIDEKGRSVTERPQRFVTDENAYPVQEFPGLTTVATRKAPDTIQIDLRREDGSLAGQATYVLSADGRSLAATNMGFDSQLRQFRQYTVWERR